MSKKGLGRGFESLIPTDLLDESFDPTASQDEQVSQLRNIKLSEITPDPDQPRRSFDPAGLEELARSVAHHGVLQPIVVVPAKNGYMIVAGERRYRAATIAGLDKIPALVRTLSGQHKLELSLIENLQREDLNVIETATAYQKLRDQFNLTLEEIGERVGGRSMSAVSNTLRLLRLPAIARQALADRELSEGQARPLIGLDESLVEQLVPTIVKESWSARQIEQYIVQLKKQGVPAKSKTIKKESPYSKEIAALSQRFQADIKVQTNSRGAGKLVISFKSDEEFERIRKLLG